MKRWAIFLLLVMLVPFAVAERVDIAKNTNDFFRQAMSDASVLRTDVAYNQYKDAADMMWNAFEAEENKCTIPRLYTLPSSQGGQFEVLGKVLGEFVSLADSTMGEVPKTFVAQAEFMHRDAVEASVKGDYARAAKIYCCAFNQLVEDKPMLLNEHTGWCGFEEDLVVAEPAKEVQKTPVVTITPPVKATKEIKAENKLDAEAKEQPKVEKKKTKKQKTKVTGQAVKTQAAPAKETQAVAKEEQNTANSKSDAVVVGVLAAIALALLVSLIFRSRPQEPTHEQAPVVENHPAQKEAVELEQAYARMDDMLKRMRRL